MLERIFAYGRVVASTLGPIAKDVLVNVRLLEPDATSPDVVAETSVEDIGYGQLGVVARPDPPDATGHTEVLVLKGGDGASPIGSRDLRLTRRTNPKEGEVMVVQYGGGFLSLAHNKDRKGTTIVLYAPTRKADDSVDKAHVITLDSAEGNRSITVQHAEGHGLYLTKNKEAILKSANGQHAITIGDGGLALTGILKLFGGVVAGNTQTAQPVALFPANAAAWTALLPVLNAIGAALASASVPAISPTSGITAAQSTAYAAALAAFATAAGAAAAAPTGGSTTLKASPL
jgi:hypothetical protein